MDWGERSTKSTYCQHGKTRTTAKDNPGQRSDTHDTHGGEHLVEKGCRVDGTERFNLKTTMADIQLGTNGTFYHKAAQK